MKKNELKSTTDGWQEYSFPVFLNDLWPFPQSDFGLVVSRWTVLVSWGVLPLAASLLSLIGESVVDLSIILKLRWSVLSVSSQQPQRAAVIRVFHLCNGGLGKQMNWKKWMKRGHVRRWGGRVISCWKKKSFRSHDAAAELWVHLTELQHVVLMSQ